MSFAGEAWRFARGLRSLVRDPPSLDGARARVANEWDARERRFLASFDRLVWSEPESPYRPLLSHAGIEPGDVASLVLERGLESALEAIRDEGVYVAHEEWLGDQPARRGSATFHFSPAQFLNPATRGDFLVGTGGTRSAGVPVTWSFASMRRGLDRYLLRASSWQVIGTPAAIWLPPLPSAVGLATALMMAGTGEPAERWFSPVPPRLDGASAKARAVNRFLPIVARALGGRVPGPRHVPPTESEPVLCWTHSALRRARRARLGAYTSSAVGLAVLARERGVSLDGLVIATLGEPLGEERAGVIRASGAEPANGYGFMQKGTVASACPACGAEEMHLLESEVALISRNRPRPDGVEVPAFLWTSIAGDSPSVLLNVENDDYGAIDVNADGCDCELGRIGMRTRISHVRGMTKVATAGMTVRAEPLIRLAEVLLPGRLGGSPGSYQFVQEWRNGQSRLRVRVHPDVGEVDEGRVLAVIAEELKRTDSGSLAEAMWSYSGALVVERAQPILTPAGKILPLTGSGPTAGSGPRAARAI